MTQMGAKIGQLYAYWLGLAQGAVPDRVDFDPGTVKPLLPNIMLIEIEDAPFRVRFRLSGTRICGQLS